MTICSFDSYVAASAFAKRISKEYKISVRLVKRSNEYIVEGEYPSAGLANLVTDIVSESQLPDVQAKKVIPTTLVYDLWVKEQGIEKSEAAEAQWWEAYKVGNESTDYSSDGSTAEQFAGGITTSVSNIPAGSDTVTSRQPTQRPEKPKKPKYLSVKPRKPTHFHVALSADTRLCIDCGVVIPQARVEAAPNVSRCIKCQSAYERTNDTRSRINEGIAGTREENIRMRYRGGS